MADGDRRTASPGQRQQPVEFALDGGGGAVVVEKHIAHQGRQAGGARLAGGDALRRGHGIEKEQPPPGELLHDAAHRLRLAGEFAAHVVVDAERVRHGFQVVLHHGAQLAGRHVGFDHTGAGIVAIGARHRQVQ